jgi:nucleoside 2-deoxyribosyltransferase
VKDSLKTYISGPLTGAVDLAAAREYYSRLASICQREGFDPYVPHLQHDPEHHASVPAELVYQEDLNNLLAADVIVAYVGAASSGAGAELAIAAAHQLPIVAVSRPGERVSRFLLGMLRVSNSVELVTSDDELQERLPGVLRDAVGSPTE